MVLSQGESTQLLVGLSWVSRSHEEWPKDSITIKLIDTRFQGRYPPVGVSLTRLPIPGCK